MYSLLFTLVLLQADSQSTDQKQPDQATWNPDARLIAQYGSDPSSRPTVPREGSSSDTDRLVREIENRRRFEAESPLAPYPKQGDAANDTVANRTIGWVLTVLAVGLAIFGISRWIYSAAAYNGGTCRRCGRKFENRGSQANLYTGTQMDTYTCPCGNQVDVVRTAGAKR
ncbi:hypothetical protein Pla8534_42500 [Lignipirellula cremea]|uniref:Uncharacterized protein n=1 Tax=Lignipirellula cremea TaxID=2528010 RepID=A0A518DX76_9BACT|nr:hypothetical protein Pla8534_42500 [Lignipirellula cremea]